MPIVSLKAHSAGDVGSESSPRFFKLISTDDLTTIKSSGYLNSRTVPNISIFPSDVFIVEYSYLETQRKGTFGLFVPIFETNGTNQTISLTEWINEGNVQKPVVDGDFASFRGNHGQIRDHGLKPSDTSFPTIPTINKLIPINTDYMVVFDAADGTIKTTASTAVHAADIHTGSSGTKGKISSFPSTQIAGRLVLECLDSPVNAFVAIKNNSHSQAANYFLNQSGFETDNSILTSSISEAEANSNILWVDVTTRASFLQNGGAQNIINSTGSRQFKIREIILNSEGTNFSGGGGNRSIQITDNTHVWTVLPTSTINNLGTNYRWGDSEVPFTVQDVNTSSTAGQSVFIEYVGGTTDFADGVLTLTICYEKVAD